MEQDELTPDWLALRHRLTFALRQLRGGSNRLSDIRVAIFGPAALTALARRAGELQHALPKKSFYAVHAEPKLFFEPSDFSALIADPDIIGLHISPKGRGSEQPIPGSLYAWAAEKFGLFRDRRESPRAESDESDAHAIVETPHRAPRHPPRRDRSMPHRRDRIRDRDGAPRHVGVQPFHHLAVELDRAARGVLRLLERRDDLARLARLLPPAA